MINFLKQLLDFIYKQQCYICKKTKENTLLCSECYKHLLQEEANHSLEVGIKEGVPYYHAGFYAKNMQKLIRGIKYHNQRAFAQYLAKFVNEYWKKFEASKQYYTIIPVPMYEAKQKKRHYNHMDLIAQEFAKLTNYTIETNLIKRIKDTKPQYGLNKLERKENLKDAFAVNDIKINHPKLLIFDDILTTGSTVNEMIKTLKGNGYLDITVLTITSIR